MKTRKRKARERGGGGAASVGNGLFDAAAQIIDRKSRPPTGATTRQTRKNGDASTRRKRQDGGNI